MRRLYDLAAADPAIRFSPYCWRVKLALAHKNLAFETIPWRFTEKEKIAFSGQAKVPVLVDGEAVIHDSDAIAAYLEAQYPETPSLFGSANARAVTRFIKDWTELTLHPAIVKIVLPDIFPQLAPEDQPYFRQTREAVFGKTIEAFAAERDHHLPALKELLTPLRKTIAEQKFFGGDTPIYADHIVFGALQWACTMSRVARRTAEGPVAIWMASLLDYYGLQKDSVSPAA